MFGVLKLQEVIFNYRNNKNTLVISHEKKSGHYSMQRNHFHEGYEIYYLLSGERFYFIGDRTFHVKKGDLIIINPYELHKTNDAGVPDHERILVHFDRAYLGQYYEDLDNVLELLFKSSNVFKLTSMQQDFVEVSLLKMMEEAKNKRLGFEAYLQSLLTQLIIYTSRNIADNSRSPFEHPSEMHKKVSEIVQYININYSQPLSLSILSDNFFISQYHMARIFKKATGFTFIEYLNSVRIKHAQKYLLESKWPVNRIAEECGFGSISQFGRIFKKITGVSPLHYKNNNKV
jgi:AraC-like DNA-binding protein